MWKLAEINLRIFHIVLGASSLHLAIAYSNNELVQDLVEAGANVSQRAIGKYYIYIQSINSMCIVYLEH